MKYVSWQKIKNLLLLSLLFVLVIFNTASSFAGPNRTTYQAKIVKPDGYPLEASSVNFKFTILDPAGSCILYSETYSSVNMGNTGGLISFSLGSGVKTYPASATTFEQVFSNISPTLACDAGGPANYNPGPNDIRKIVMQFHDGSGWQTLPAMSINAVPYAMYANEASKLNGKTDADFVQAASLTTCASGEALTFTGAGFSCVVIPTPQAVSASAVVAALGYTPADGASVTTLNATISSVSSTVALVSSTVASVSSTVFSVSSTVSSLANTVSNLSTTVSDLSASMAAMVSSQWVTSGTTIYYNNNYVGIGTSAPTANISFAGGLGTQNIVVDRNSSGSGSGLQLRAGGAAVNATDANGGTLFLSSGLSTGMGYSQIIMRTMSGTVSGNSDNVYINRLVVLGNGNVGMGTNTPATKLDVAGGVKIGTEASTCAASLAGTLRYNAGAVEYCNGTTWAAFGVSGAGLQSLNGSTSGTQNFAVGSNGTTLNISSVNGLHTFNIPLASTGAVTGGLLSNADYTTFMGKITSSVASIAQVLGYAPVSTTTLGNYLTKANNLSDLASSATARTNLGLGTFATASSIDLGSASATGTLAAGRLPAFSGDATSVSGSNVLTLANSGVSAGVYSKVTVNAKGLVTSGAQLTSSDVTTALGFTPGAAASGVTLLNGSASQTQTFAYGTTGTAPAFVTANGVHTLNIPLASAASVTGGLLSNVDYATFTGYAASIATLTSNLAIVSSTKITSSPASIAAVLGYTPASSTQLSNFLVKANNLSDLVSSATARTNLGVGYIGTLASVDLGSADVSGTLAIARTPAYTGDVTKAAASNTLILSNSGVTAGTYNKVTVDAKGRVTSSSALTNSDVVTALGFTPGAATSGVTSLNGSTSQTQTFAVGTAGTAPAFNTAAGVHTLNIPLASAASVTGGLLSNADYATFTGYAASIATLTSNLAIVSSTKITSSAASIAAVLGYTPASATSLANYLVKTNNLSDLVSSATARTNLGVGYIGTLTSVDLGSTDVSGTLAIARTPAYTGDVTKAAASNTLILSNSGVTAGTYNKVTVDAKGRVTSSSALNVSDVTTALGYTPASATASTQWTTSGTTINYMAGNVGIGTSAPTQALHVIGNIYSQGSFISSNGAMSLTDSSTQAQRVNVDSTNGIIFMTGASATERARFDKTTGNFGLGVTAPTAVLHLRSGTSQTAALKLASGTLLTSPQSGTIEYDGTNYYITDGNSVRRTIATVTSSGTLDGAAIINNSTGNIVMTPNSSVVVSSTTASTNSQTGALIVNGGIGVAGNIYSSGTILTSSNIQGVSITATSGMIAPYIAGGVGSGVDITIDSTTHSSKGDILLGPNGGNVGIGTATPGGVLHVADSAAADIRLENTGATSSALRILSQNGATYIQSGVSFGAASTADLRFTNMMGSTTWMTLKAATGNLGIGAATPAGKLTVVSGGQVINIGTGTNSSGYTFNFGLNDDGINFDNSSNIRGYNFKNGNGTLVTISAAGNVGIGTSAPTQKLDVNGGIKSIYGEPTGSNANASGFSFDGDTGMFAAGDGMLNFWSNNQRTMSVYQGKVGIGTSSPTQALDVSGTAKANFFSGDGSLLTNISAANLTFYNYPSGYASGAVPFSSFSQGVTGWQDYTGTALGVSSTYWAGITTKNGNTGAQFAVNWDNNGNTPSGFRIRSQDDNFGSWGQWRSVAFIDATVKLSGDTMTGTLNLPSNGLAVGTDQLVVSGTNVGIGTVVPDSALNVVGTGGGDDDVHIDSYSNTQEGTVMLRRARGTAAAPTTLLSGDRMGFYTFRGYNGTSFLDLSRIQASTEADLSVSASSNLQFFTTDNGTTTEKIRITASGAVGVGTTAPTAGYRMDVLGDMYVGAGGASQTIRFRTVNTDGAFIRFNSTADSAGNSWLEIGTTDNNDEPIIFTQSGNERMRIHTNGALGIGTKTPDRNASVVESTGGSGRGLTVRTFNSTNTGGVMEVAGGLGTPTAPTALTNNMSLGFYTLTGYDGSSVPMQSTPNGMYSSATEDWSTSAHGANLRFATTPNGTTNGAERMRIDQNGYVGIGTTAPQRTLHVNGDAYVNAITGGQNNGSGNFHLDAWSSGADRSVYLNWSTGTGGAKVGNGSSTWGPISASAFNTSSDKRLKENIKPIQNSLEKILKINAVTFTWKDASRNKMEGERIGLIAQNVEQVFPQAVKVDHGENTLPGGTKLVTYPDLVSPIIAALKEFYALWFSDSKELHKTIEEQKREMASVKEELNMLKEKSSGLEEQNKALKDYLCEKDPNAKICK